MTATIAIIGNSRLHIGMALAGDLALGGHDVRFAPWPDQPELLDLIMVGRHAEAVLQSQSSIWKRILGESKVELMVSRFIAYIL